jgi:hypothetical protein
MKDDGSTCEFDASQPECIVWDGTSCIETEGKNPPYMNACGMYATTAAIQNDNAALFTDHASFPGCRECPLGCTSCYMKEDELFCSACQAGFFFSYNDDNDGDIENDTSKPVGLICLPIRGMGPDYVTDNSAYDTSTD